MLSTVGLEAEQARQEFKRVQEVEKEAYVLEKAQQGASVEEAEKMYDKLASISEHELMSQVLPSALASGSTEFIPLASMFKRMDKATGGTFSDFFFQKIKDGAVNTLEGGVQEAMQQVISNFTAQETYDVGRDILDDVRNAAEVGVGTQLVLNILMGAATGRKRSAITREDQKKLDQLRKDVEDAEDQVAARVADEVLGEATMEEKVPSEKAEAVTPEGEQKPAESEEAPTPSPTIEESLGESVTYQGEQGILVQTETGDIAVRSEGQERLVEGSDKDLTKTIEEVGVESRPVEVPEENRVVVEGKEYGFISVNTDEEGKIVSLTVDDQGKKKTIRDPAVALKADIERNKLPNQYQLEEEGEVERFNEDLAQAIGEDESIDLDADQARQVNDILDRTATEAVNKALDGDLSQMTEDELVEASLWAEDAVSGIEGLNLESSYAQKVVEDLKQFKTTIDGTIKDPDRLKGTSPASYIEKRERGLDENVLQRAIAYEEGTSVEGSPDERVIPTGERIKGKWKLVEADDITASHDEESFAMNVGFPVVEGRTANDRDYANDPVAQAQVEEMANKFDERALQDPIIVSEDGIVMSGNNRTMSRKKAAKQGTDEAYIEGLKKQAQEKGIDPSAIEKMNKPTLVFEQEGTPDYSTASFAKFNVAEKKAKTGVDEAITVARKMDEGVRENLNEKVARFENLAEFHKNKKAVRESVNLMVESGMIPSHELNQYYDQTTGTLTDRGKDFFETALITGIVNEDSLRLLNQPGLKNLRQKIVRSIVPLAESATYGQEYDLSNAVNEAVNLQNEALSSEQTVEEFIAQGNLFEEGAATYSTEGILMANLFEKTQLEFLAAIKAYNKAAATAGGMFSELTATQEEILNQLEDATQTQEQDTGKLAEQEPGGKPKKGTKGRRKTKRGKKRRRGRVKGKKKSAGDIVEEAKSEYKKQGKEGSLFSGKPDSDEFGFFDGTMAGFNISGEALNNAKNLFNKWFTTKGNLPSEIFQEKVKRDARLNATQRKIQQTVAKFKEAIRKKYKKKPDITIIKGMDDALKGDQDAMDALDDDIAAAIRDMRMQIDQLSQDLRNLGITDGDLDSVIEENMGVYVTRSYRKHTDPKWNKTKVPPDVWNRASDAVEQAIQEEIDTLESKETLTENQQEQLDYFKEQIEDIDGVLEFLITEKPETATKEGNRLGAKDLNILKKRVLGELKVGNRDINKIVELTQQEANALFDQQKRQYWEDKIQKAVTKRLKSANDIEKAYYQNTTPSDILNFLVSDTPATLPQKTMNRTSAKSLRKKIKKDLGISNKAFNKDIKSAKADLFAQMDPRDYVADELAKAVANGDTKRMNYLRTIEDDLLQQSEYQEALRELYGEYRDPMFNYANSVTKIAHIIHNHKFLEEVIKVGEGKFLFKTKKSGFSTPLGTKSFGPKNVERTAWAPLENYHTSPEIAEALFNSNDPKLTEHWLRHIIRASSGVKYAKTILSVSTHFRNVMGNGIFVMRNGHFGNSAPEIIALYNEMFKTGKVTDKQAAYVNRAVELGVLYDSPRAGELRDLMKDVQEGEFAGLPEISDVFENKAIQLSKKGKRTIEKLYQFEDDMFKLNAWEVEKKRYAKQLYGKDFKDLTADERNDVEERTAAIVRKIYPTYSFVPKAVRQLRRVPFVGTFVAFPSEVIRSTAANISLIRQEIADPKLRPLGYKRAAWFSSAAVTPTLVTMAAKEMTGAWDDEDTEEAYRAWMPPWSANSEIVFIDPVDKNGSFTYIDLGQMDPQALFKKPIYEFIYDENDDSLFKTSLDATAEMLKPFIGEEILYKHIDEALNNQKRSGGKIYLDNADIEEKLAKTFAHIANAFEPSTIRQARRIYKSYYKTETGEMTRLSPKVEWKAMFGIRVSRMNVNDAYGFDAWLWSKTKADAKKRFYSELYKEKTMRPSETQQEFQTRKQREIMDALDYSNDYYDKLMDEVVWKTEQAMKMGMPPEKIFQLLTANRRFTQEEATFIILGEKPPFKVKPQKLK